MKLNIFARKQKIVIINIRQLLQCLIHYAYSLAKTKRKSTTLLCKIPGLTMSTGIPTNR